MIVFDIETTGIDPEKNSIVSIGAVSFEDPDRTFYGECRVWDRAEIADKALEINGYSREEVIDRNKKTESELVLNFISWLEEGEDFSLAGLNPQFDISFLDSARKRAGSDFRIKHRAIDLHSVGYLHMKQRGVAPTDHLDLSGDMIMEYVGIPTEPKPHIALNGAIWETEALSRLLNDRILQPQFQDMEIPWK